MRDTWTYTHRKKNPPKSNSAFAKFTQTKASVHTSARWNTYASEHTHSGTHPWHHCQTSVGTSIISTEPRYAIEMHTLPAGLTLLPASQLHSVCICVCVLGKNKTKKTSKKQTPTLSACLYMMVSMACHCMSQLGSGAWLVSTVFSLPPKRSDLQPITMHQFNMTLVVNPDMNLT